MGGVHPGQAANLSAVSRCCFDAIFPPQSTQRGNGANHARRVLRDFLVQQHKILGRGFKSVPYFSTVLWRNVLANFNSAGVSNVPVCQQVGECGARETED
jgi:hypothetical protein